MSPPFQHFLAVAVGWALLIVSWADVKGCLGSFFFANIFILFGLVSWLVVDMRMYGKYDSILPLAHRLPV